MALKKFLRASDHEKWFESSAIKRSAIPLYCLACHIFHQPVNTRELEDLFNQFDVSDRNFRNMSLWLKMSLLKQVFRKSSGWSPDKTSISKIHEFMDKNKGKDFPIMALFGLYRERLHRFIDEKAIAPSTLDLLDQEYMYNGTTRSSIRFEDKDHIQPRSLLHAANVDSVKINSIGNLQLIDSNSNRVRKNDRPLAERLHDIDDKTKYLERHLIPNEPNLWEVGAFEDFLAARLANISSKLTPSL